MKLKLYGQTEALVNKMLEEIKNLSPEEYKDYLNRLPSSLCSIGK